MVWLPDAEENFDDMFSRFDRIPTCGGQTDGQTSCHGIVRAMHTRRAVKIEFATSPIGLVCAALP